MEDGFGADLKQSAEGLLKAADEVSEQVTNEMTAGAIEQSLEQAGHSGLKANVVPVSMQQVSPA